MLLVTLMKVIFPSDFTFAACRVNRYSPLTLVSCADHESVSTLWTSTAYVDGTYKIVPPPRNIRLSNLLHLRTRGCTGNDHINCTKLGCGRLKEIGNIALGGQVTLNRHNFGLRIRAFDFLLQCF